MERFVVAMHQASKSGLVAGAGTCDQGVVEIRYGVFRHGAWRAGEGSDRECDVTMGRALTTGAPGSNSRRAARYFRKEGSKDIGLRRQCRIGVGEPRIELMSMRRLTCASHRRSMHESLSINPQRWRAR
jgi:hypothetical protein